MAQEQKRRPENTKTCGKGEGSIGHQQSTGPDRTYYEQLITMCAVAESKCAVENDNVYTKKCRDPGLNDDLCADYQVSFSCKSCLKCALL